MVCYIFCCTPCYRIVIATDVFLVTAFGNIYGKEFRLACDYCSFQRFCYLRLFEWSLCLVLLIVCSNSLATFRLHSRACKFYHYPRCIYRFMNLRGTFYTIKNATTRVEKINRKRHSLSRYSGAVLIISTGSNCRVVTLKARVCVRSCESIAHTHTHILHIISRLILF